MRKLMLGTDYAWGWVLTLLLLMAALPTVVMGGVGQTITGKLGSNAAGVPGNALASASSSVTTVEHKIFVSHAGAAANRPQLTVSYTPLAAALSVSGQVSQSSDDAEEAGPDATGSHPPGYMDFTSSDIEFTTDKDTGGGYSGGTQKIGMRFNTLNVPRGATITNAYIILRAETADSPNTNTSTTSLTLRGQAADNPTTFTSTAYDITNRSTTAASVAWTPTSWTTGSDYNSPDLKAIVQEIVNRSGWASGNSMAFIITGSGSRTAESWNGTGTNQPRLVIEYSIGSSGPSLGNTLSAAPALVIPGNLINVSMSLTSATSIANVSPNPLLLTGSNGVNATLVSGPTPASATVGPTATTFTWVYQATSTGTVGTLSFEGNADDNGSAIWPNAQTSSVIAPQSTGLTISGLVYFDSNANRIPEVDEPGVWNALVELWSNNTKLSSTFTDEDGRYGFADLSSASYSVVQINLPEYASATPDVLTVSLVSSSLENANFGDYLPLTVTGSVFNDRDASGFRGLGEEGVPDAVVDIFDDANTNGQVDSGETRLAITISDSQGNYILRGISPGNRVLRLAPPSGLNPPGDGEIPMVLVSSEASGNAHQLDLALLAVAPLLCTTNSLIDARFNSTAIPAAAYLWFSGRMKVTGLGTLPTSITFDRSVINFTAGATPYELAVPAGTVTFLPTASSSSTSFGVAGWSTTVSPANNSQYVFLTGLAFPAPAGGLPGKISPVTWTGRYVTAQPGLVIEWSWSAAVYSSFSADYNTLGVKPVDGSQQNPYANSDQAGAPQNYKSFVAAGARGKGGSNYTGSASTSGYAAPCASPDSLPYLQRVNAGGVTYTEPATGIVWGADKPFTVGSWGYSGGSAQTSSNTIDGSVEDVLLYQKFRENMASYAFSAPAGLYEVSLRFAEFTAIDASERVMKITLEDNVVENNLSIFEQTGGRNRVLHRTYQVNLSDGVLNIVFAKQPGSRYDPIVSVLQVRSLPAGLPAATPTATPTAMPTAVPTATPTPTPAAYSQAVNSGSTSYTDVGGQVWASDRTYIVGSWGRMDGVARSSGAGVLGTQDDQLYQRYIEKPGEYRFTVPNGTYTVIIKLAEFVAKNSSERVMSLTLEGSPAVSNLSIFGLVGKNVALDLTYTVVVQDGILNVGFVKAPTSAKDPVVSAISVRRQ